MAGQLDFELGLDSDVEIKNQVAGKCYWNTIMNERLLVYNTTANSL